MNTFQIDFHGISSEFRIKIETIFMWRYNLAQIIGNDCPA
jgi:hypothetical protein